MAPTSRIPLDPLAAKIPLQTRRVCLEDLPSLPPIFNHIIVNTVISFRLSPVDVDFYREIVNTTCAHDLPFLVATTPTASIVTGEKVIGYAYAMPWRESRRAYRHTAELTIYVHPEYQAVGVGSALMDALMAALRTAPARNPKTQSPSVDEGELEQLDRAGRIREVLATMTLDTEAKDGGCGLVKFYSRWGFEQVGHMKRVGFKLGRWLDTLILQASL